MVLSTLRRSFKNHPLIANVATMTSLLAAADLTCQVIENKGFTNFKWERLRNMSTMGIIYYGPVFFYYYRFLDRKFPGKDRKTIMIKLLIDQCVMPVTNFLVFYIAIGKLERKTWDECEAEIRKKFLPAYITSCLFWPAAQIINFRYIPSVYRLTFVSMTTYVWLTFISYVKNKPDLPFLLQKIEDLTSGVSSN